MRIALTVLVVLLGAAGACAADPPRTWNLLLVTADDLNADSAGWMGNKLGATPNLDAFAKSAHRFVNHHVTVPICQPGREALLTGRVPHRSGALGFHPIRADVPTLVEELRGAGYYTAAIAKVAHMTPVQKFPWHATGAQSLGKDPDKFRARLREMLAEGKKTGKPFFINANICDPHRPFVGAESKGMKVDDAPTNGVRVYKKHEVTVPAFLEDLPRVREEVAQYYTSVSRFDRTFGLVMAELAAAGHEADTIVVFLSDHGMSLPFSKATVYRNGTWSPVLIRVPGLGEPREHRDFVSSVDMMPSLLELLRMKQPEGMDGRSWVPLLKGEKQAERDCVVTHVNTVSSGKSFAQRCVRTGNRSLMFHAWVGGPVRFRVEAMSGLSFAAMNASTDPQVQNRVKQLVEGEPLMLFDTQADPSERTNLIRDPRYAADVVALSGKLLAHMKKTGDPLTNPFEAAVAKLQAE